MEKKRVFIEIFDGPVLALTDGEGSGVELAGIHRSEWGAVRSSFELTEHAAKDLVATLQATFPSVNKFRSDFPGPEQSI